MLEGGEELEKITRELAEAIMARADGLWRSLPTTDQAGGYAEEHMRDCFRKAIEEYTTKPGDHEFCWPGEGKRCYFYQGEGMLHMWPEAWEGTMKCTHYKSKPGCCPLDLHRCGGRLMPARFMVEDAQAPEGYRDAQGFRCDKCGEEVITAQEARRIEQLDASDKIGREG